MSKTKEELNALKKEVEAVNEKLQELTPEGRRFKPYSGSYMVR